MNLNAPSPTEKAMQYALIEHAGQRRKYTGTPYVFHVFRVGMAAQAFGLPEEAVQAAFLHDVIEDCDVSYEQVAAEFGPAVATIVAELTNDKTMPGTRAERKKADRERLSAVSLNAKIIKLIDRLDNLKEMTGATPEFLAMYKKETRLLLTALNTPTLTISSSLPISNLYMEVWRASS